MGRSKYTFFQRRQRDDQKAHEKMLNMTIKRITNQNYSEVSPNTSWNCNQSKNVGVSTEKGKPSILLVGI